MYRTGTGFSRGLVSRMSMADGQVSGLNPEEPVDLENEGSVFELRIAAALGGPRIGVDRKELAARGILPAEP